MNTKLIVWANPCCWAARIDELTGEFNEQGLDDSELTIEVQFTNKPYHATDCDKRQ